MTYTSGSLPPSTALMMVENALEHIVLDAPNRELDDNLRFNLGGLGNTLQDAPEANEHLDKACAHVQAMYKARDKNDLETGKRARKDALLACAPLHGIISKRKLL